MIQRETIITIMDKIVLICATGRSGSTTLQRIINTIPNSNICGENMGAVNSLLEFYKRLKITTRDYVPGHLHPASYAEIVQNNIKPAWYNSYNLNDITRMIQMLIIKLFKKSFSTCVWGFKEIRYDGSFNNHIFYIDEFLELFPRTKVIIQIRQNTHAQSQSGWFKKDTRSLKLLNAVNKRMQNYYNNHKAFCYFTTFEKMFDMTNLREMFTFIDCAKDFNEEHIKQVLDNNIKD